MSLINKSLAFSSDIDECLSDITPCDENASCTNSDGSYNCECRQGFTGEGKTCEGTSNESINYSLNNSLLRKTKFIFRKCLFHQILTNAHRISVCAMKTLFVPTVAGLTAAHANRDLLETERLAKVSKDRLFFFFKLSNFPFIYDAVQYLYFRFPFIPSDIDECSMDPSRCDNKADCFNTDGSYSCKCKQGFTGNGTVCEGIEHCFYWILVYMQR